MTSEPFDVGINYWTGTYMGDPTHDEPLDDENDPMEGWAYDPENPFHTDSVDRYDDDAPTPASGD
jgi:hypothetical protein